MPKSVFEGKTKTINLKPFPYTLKLVMTDDIRGTEKALRLKYGDVCTKIVANERTGAMAMHDKGLETMFILMPYKCDVGYIAHEVWHIVRAMLLYSGASLDNEVVAYYIGWLVREATVFNYTASKKKAELDKQAADTVV